MDEQRQRCLYPYIIDDRDMILFLGVVVLAEQWREWVGSVWLSLSAEVEFGSAILFWVVIPASANCIHFSSPFPSLGIYIQSQSVSHGAAAILRRV